MALQLGPIRHGSNLLGAVWRCEGGWSSYAAVGAFAIATTFRAYMWADNATNALNPGRFTPPPAGHTAARVPGRGLASACGCGTFARCEVRYLALRSWGWSWPP